MKRTLCISDIHGQYDKFIKILKMAKYNYKEDNLIVLGDIVDRGTQNIKTIEKMIEMKEQGAIIIKGNHDELAEGTLYDLINDTMTFRTQNHVMCDGYSTYEEFLTLSKDKLIEFYNFFKNLPYYYEENNYIFVHAGINNSKPLEMNSIDDFTWSRDKFFNNKAYSDKVVVFGHTPTCNMICPKKERSQLIKDDFYIWYDKTYNDKIGIDCGSIFNGKMAILELPTMKEFYL